jgi:cell division protein ZapD
MRLEGIFARIDFFSARETFWDHHAALQALFEGADVSARADLKSDLLQELERQKLALASLRHRQNVDLTALDRLLTDISEAISEIFSCTGKVGAHLRENEWLMSIKQRMSLPGGASGFDLPAFHFWLHQPVQQRRHDLRQWIIPFQPIQNGVRIILNLLRESGQSIPYVAESGVFQLMQNNSKTAQLLRVSVNDAISCVPEISANKYAINIRFISVAGITRGSPCDCDTSFELTLCQL